MNGYIIRNQYGAFCSVCQSHLSMEEDDFDTCDACGGEGFGEDEYDDGYGDDDFDYDADHRANVLQSRKAHIDI